MDGTLAVAALSARLMAESARRGGYRVVAMDVFGDVDTRRAASAWHRIGKAVTMRLDPDRTIVALETFAREPDALGWIVGSGFEAMPDVLARGAAIVRLIGNEPSVMSRVREPATFFARLDALGIAHPPTSLTPPQLPAGWLVKDAVGSGAWHIRSADSDNRKPGPGSYYQRRMRGRSLGALFIANGRDARIIGISEQTIRARNGHPYVYCGIVGPVHLPDAVATRIEDAVQAVVRDFGLVGLNSFDFLLDGDQFFVLEVNARPSSSIALYDGAFERGLMRAHVEALTAGTLPAAHRAPALNGNEIVFAERRCDATSEIVRRFADSGWCCDVPHPGTSFTSGEPVCTVKAQAGSLNDLRALLDERRRCVESWLLEASP